MTTLNGSAPAQHLFECGANTPRPPKGWRHAAPKMSLSESLANNYSSLGIMEATFRVP